MASYGYSPATRMFEAAGAAACIISDAWLGIEAFLEPGREILLAANGTHVDEHINALTHARAHEIGARARRRVLSEHTYRHRAEQVEQALGAATIKHHQTPRFEQVG
jgi:spore maturation protein CgeB